MSNGQVSCTSFLYKFLDCVSPPLSLYADAFGPISLATRTGAVPATAPVNRAKLAESNQSLVLRITSHCCLTAAPVAYVYMYLRNTCRELQGAPIKKNNTLGKIQYFFPPNLQLLQKRIRAKYPANLTKISDFI